MTVKRAIGNAFPALQGYVRIRRGYTGAIGGPPRILFPRTFNEKVQHRKLFEHDPRMPLRADKIAVKDFVTDKLGDGWVTPTLWFGTELPPLEQRDWPMPFVLKASHGSVMNVFVHGTPNWPSIETLCQKWLSETYGDWGGEWLYSQIQPRLLVEPFIGDLAMLPVDYKLWTFHGRVEFIAVDTDRETDHKRVVFDRRWNRLPFTFGFPTDPRPIPKPASLSDLIDAAETLSEGVSFVRADFYEINDSPRFGELTYYPGSGLEPFFPAEYDRIVGDLW